MSKYLKKSLVPLMILLVPYMSLPTKAMNEEHVSDIHSHIPLKDKKVVEDSLEDKASQAVSLQSHSSQLTNLDESQSTLSSKIASGFKYGVNYGVQAAWDLGVATVTSPKLAGLYVLTNFVAVAADYQCVVECFNGKWLQLPNIYYGCDNNQCAMLCSASNPQVQAICSGYGVGSAGCQTTGKWCP